MYTEVDTFNIVQWEQLYNKSGHLSGSFKSREETAETESSCRSSSVTMMIGLQMMEPLHHCPGQLLNWGRAKGTLRCLLAGYQSTARDDGAGPQLMTAPRMMAGETLHWPFLRVDWISNMTECNPLANSSLLRCRCCSPSPLSAYR